MRPSPARIAAPEPESWIPIESLTALPELEELLDPRYLVDSGQTRAVRMGDDGKGYVFVDSEIEAALEHEKKENRELSHRRWRSHRRTLVLKRRAKIQKYAIIATSLVVIMAVCSAAFYVFRSTPAGATSRGPSAFIPTLVPVVIEGEKSNVLSVATSMKDFQREQKLADLIPMQKDFDRASFGLKRSIPAIEFRHNKSMTLTVDGSSKIISTTDLTVGDALVNSGTIIDGDDIVSPARETAALGVTSITVTRVSTQTRSEERSIPFATEKQNDPSLAKGKTSIKRAGVAGKEIVTFTQTMNNGTVASESESQRVVVKAPVSQIVLVGTKNPESQSGKATFYAAPTGTCAHKTLPMGTIITVRNVATGASASCRVADRGPFGAGRVIDLSKDVFSKIAPLSQGVVPVTLAW